MSMFKGFCKAFVLVGVWSLLGCGEIGTALSDPASVRGGGNDLTLNRPIYINNQSSPIVVLNGKCPPGVEKVELGEPINQSSTCEKEGYSFSFNTSAWSEGEKKIEVKSGAITSYFSVIKDITNPVVAFTSGHLTTVTAGNASAFSVTGTCSEEGLPVYVRSPAVQKDLLCTSGHFSTNLDLSIFSDGTLAISVTHVDAAGNVGSSSLALNKSTTGTPIASTAGKLKKSVSGILGGGHHEVVQDGYKISAGVGTENSSVRIEGSNGYVIYGSTQGIQFSK